MRMRFSGVLAASIIAAGVFWNCSESSDGVSVPEVQRFEAFFRRATLCNTRKSNDKALQKAGRRGYVFL